MILDISSGKLMIVSDIHGNGFDFRQVLKTYNSLKENGEADYLIFLGDLIHAYPGKQKDESLEIMQELMHLKANTKGNDVICLLGNHEFVHIYHIPLQKGPLEFTTWFENRIKKVRKEIVSFFIDMPIMIRTHGGVLINHAGASNCYGSKNTVSLNDLKRMNHKPNFKEHIKSIDKYNMHVGFNFMNTKEGELLWDILMNGNEKEYGDDYLKYIDDLLKLSSEDRLERPMKTLVCGHIAAYYGAETVGDHQLRICSSAGCLGDLEKKYLLISADKNYANSEELLMHCRDLY
nr:metallophosphoesterase [uncultured Marinifilum sp.]